MSSFLYELNIQTSVATITLNRPDRLNALTFETYTDLRDTFAEAQGKMELAGVLRRATDRPAQVGGQ